MRHLRGPLAYMRHAFNIQAYRGMYTNAVALNKSALVWWCSVQIWRKVREQWPRRRCGPLCVVDRQHHHSAQVGFWLAGSRWFSCTCTLHGKTSRRAWRGSNLFIHPSMFSNWLLYQNELWSKNFNGNGKVNSNGKTRKRWLRLVSRLINS